MILKFTDKEDYVTDGEMSNCYLHHGLKLENITSKNKLQYEKSDCLIPHIGFNITKRKEAKAKSDKLGDVLFG